ncbi:putative Zn finger protein [Streptomyces sp. KhCrAH-43]|nr:MULTISPECIES: SWIM zinc finger family protein [unclassified Streptomyces]RAJ57852.1 putative Zn finger protein [Streptomyces sp. KhCrAH-43]
MRDIQLPFDEASVRRAAGSTSFERGQNYVGAVSGLCIAPGTIRATVPGAETYDVELVARPDAVVAGTCSCPYGTEGNFCKHCVAVGLAALRNTAPNAHAVPVPALEARSPKRPGNDAAAWLTTLDRDALLDLLAEESAADPAVHDRLRIRAEAAQADHARIRDLIKGLLDPGDWQYEQENDDSANAVAYGERVAEAGIVLSALIAAQRAAEAVDGIRWALWRLSDVHERALGFSCLYEPMKGLEQLHLRACRAAGPHPEPTTRWLVGHLLGPFGEVASVDPADYRDLLGEAGLTRALELATEAWRQEPGRKTARLVERLLKARGDIDGLVAFLGASPAADGSSHLRIARELDAAGRPGDALEWAERGLQAAGQNPQLVEWLCARYAAAGRHEEALALRRDAFRSRISLTAFRALCAAARACGRGEEERDAAMALLRDDGRVPVRVRVDILLDAGRADAAWEAAVGQVDDDELLPLADCIRDHRPSDALAVYLRRLQDLKQSTGDRTYHEIARLLRSIRACHERLGTPDAFTHFLAALRKELKRKPKLMGILTTNGL